MPNTISAAIVVLLMVLPGIPGDKIYCFLVGANWKHSTWHESLRLLGFSVLGLAIYTMASVVVDAPPPIYLIPDRLPDLLSDSRSAAKAFGAYLGHLVGSGASGMLVGASLRALQKSGRVTPFYSAWDHFLQVCVAHHWVLIALKNGEVYCGKLELAEPSVSVSERDIVLEEPAIYDEESQNYIALGHQHLFIPGELVSSLATLHDPLRDAREFRVGAKIFAERREDGDSSQENDAEAAG